MITSDYRNIKIDKSILWNVAKDSNDPELLESLVGFIKSMGSDIIQEGVETKEQLDLVTKCGCDYIQGFYFSKPILKEEFFEYIEKEVA
jgi:EAL domain-containing protein (putative c-di-GMP-specific phosphodiesterase class I)